MMDLTVLREKVLSDCPPEKAFWTCHGSIVRNLYELVDFIRTHNESVFRYHVNSDNNKNDFAKWIYEVLGDEELAARVFKVIDKDRYVDIIEQRIHELESC